MRLFETSVTEIGCSPFYLKSHQPTGTMVLKRSIATTWEEEAREHFLKF